VDLPSHPEADDPDDNAGSDAGRERPTPASRTAVLVIAVIAALLVVVVLLHLAGALGPGAH
jgi:hypothetical protein